AEPELLGDAPARRVPRHDGRFEPVQAERFEREADEYHDAFGHVPVAALLLVDPVTDVAHLERPALHAPEADLADEPAGQQEEPEPVRGVEVPLPLPRRAPGAERIVIDRRIRTARLGYRLPALEPVAAAQTHLAPRLPVVGLQRPQRDPGA